nr:TolC family protein [uncultured Pseudomonas sp.]
MAPPTATPSSRAALSRRWWEGFEDQSFERLIVLALRDNIDLLSATEQLRAQYSQAAALLPDLSSSGNHGCPRNTLDWRTNEHFYGLDLAWKLDVSGRLRANVCDVELRTATEDYCSLRIGLMAEVANTYLRYRLGEQQLVIASHANASQSEIARVTSAGFAQGALKRLDVERIRAPVQEVKPLRHSNQDALVAVLEVPVEIFRERPDVCADSERLQVVGGVVMASLAACYPQLTLCALDGFERWASAPALPFTAGLMQPLCDFGRIRDGIEASDVHWNRVLLAYKTSQLLDQISVAASTRAVHLASNQYEVGGLRVTVGSAGRRAQPG